MRLLHQIRPREQLLASGVYHEAGGAREQWLWNQFPDGARMLRTDRESGLRELYFGEDGALERVDWLKFTVSARVSPRARGTLHFLPDGAHLGEQRGREQRRYHEWELAADCLRWPPALVALGHFARALGAAGGEAAVFFLREGAAGMAGELQRWRARADEPTLWRITAECGDELRLVLDESGAGIPTRIVGAWAGRAVDWRLRDFLLRRAPV